MKVDEQRLLDYLSHIREAIERIHRYVFDVDELTFLQDEMVQDAVIRNIEIIGEASHNIEQRYPDFAAALQRPTALRLPPLRPSKPAFPTIAAAARIWQRNWVSANGHSTGA